MHKLTLFLAALSLLLTTSGVRAQAPAWQADVQLPARSTDMYQADVLASDAAGNLYLAGQFRGQLRLGTAGTLTSRGFMDLFIAKWSPATASFQWAQQVSSIGTVVPRRLVVSGSSVYVGGTYNATTNFGSSTLLTAGQHDVFVAKLSDQGSAASWVWAQGAGGPQYDDLMGLAVSGSTLYATGFFSGTADFRGNTLNSAGQLDGFVTSLTDQGSTVGVNWAEAVGGAGYDAATAVAVSGGAVYVAGSFSQSINNLLLSSAGGSDAFVARFTDTGSGPQWLWASRAGGALGESVEALAVEGSSIYLAGLLGSTGALFGSTTLSATPAPGTSSVTAFDGYVARLTDTGSAGSFDWAHSFGGSSDDAARSLAVRGGNVYLSGTSTGLAAFGSTTLTSSSPATDLFLTKLSDAGSSASFSWAVSAGGSGTDVAYALALAGSRAYVVGRVGPPASFSGTVVSNPNPNSTADPVSVLASVQDQALASRATTALPADELSLAPNPARTTASLRLPAGVAADAVITLTDLLGRPVRPRSATRDLGAGRYTLDLGGLPAGTYLVQVRAGSTRAVRRLVVE